MDIYIDIGRLGKTHGLKGWISLYFNESFIEPLSLPIFIKHDHTFLPYFIEKYKSCDHKHALIKVEDINSKESATLIKGKKIYCPSEELSKYINKHTDEASSLSDIYLKGYTLIDSNNKQIIGEVLDLIQLPSQEILQVMVGQKEVLIPYRKEWVIFLNETSRQLTYKIPVGLLNVYLT